MADFKHKFGSMSTGTAMPAFLSEPRPNIFSVLSQESSEKPQVKNEGSIIVDNTKFNVNSLLSNKNFISILVILILIMLIVIGLVIIKMKSQSPVKNNSKLLEDDNNIKPRPRLAGAPISVATNDVTDVNRELTKIRNDIKFIMAHLDKQLPSN